MTEITAGQASDAARFTAIVAELAEYIAANLTYGPGGPFGHPGLTVPSDGQPPTDVAGIRACLASGHVWLSWMDEKVTAGLRELDWLTRGDGNRPRESPAVGLTAPAATGDPVTDDLLQITDPGELLAAVFDAQREAEQHLDGACQAAGWNTAYESGGAFAESEARHYRAAAASLRRGAALLDKLAGAGNIQAAPVPGGGQ